MKIPYKPSWVDRLTNWIESLPVPVWTFYLILYLIAALSLNLASWLNGALPWGVASASQFYNAIWLPLALFVIHNTDQVAKHALARFGSLVRNKAAQLEDITYQMTNMPARTVLWISIVAVTVLLIGAIQDPKLVVFDLSAGPIHPVTWALSALFGVTSYSLAPIMIYHAARQLNLVTKAYELVDKVDVFHQQPMYAFSGLTMRTALFLVALVYITYMGEVIYDPSSTEDVINLALSVVIIPLSVVIVLLPLWGIHQRLGEARMLVLEKNSTQITNTRTKLYKAIDKQSYNDVKGLDGALSSLYREQKQLENVATWPWAPGTFRNFLTAVLIPMLLWLAQTLAARFL